MKIRSKRNYPKNGKKLKLTSNRGGGKPLPLSFCFKSLGTLNRRPVVACAGPNFHYTTRHTKNQLTFCTNFRLIFFPNLCNLTKTFFEKSINFSVGLWYNVREVKGRGNNPHEKKLKKFQKNP